MNISQAPQKPVPGETAPLTEPQTFSEALRAELNRIESEEQTRIDRDRQQELARLREVARFD